MRDRYSAPKKTEPTGVGVGRLLFYYYHYSAEIGQQIINRTNWK